MRPSGKMGGEEREEKGGKERKKRIQNYVNKDRREWEEEKGRKGTGGGKGRQTFTQWSTRKQREECEGMNLRRHLTE